MSCVKSYTYPIGGENIQGLFFGNQPTHNVKYYININIMGPDGNYKPVKVIADTGNDITLLTKRTGQYLGFNPSVGAMLEVSGIREGMVSHFKKITTFVQLGNLTPVKAEIGFALEQDALQENLLGNKGILSSGHFEFRYDDKSLTIVDKINTCDTTTGMNLERQKYLADNKNEPSAYWTFFKNRNFY